MRFLETLGGLPCGSLPSPGARLSAQGGCGIVGTWPSKRGQGWRGHLGVGQKALPAPSAGFLSLTSLESSCNRISPIWGAVLPLPRFQALPSLGFNFRPPCLGGEGSGTRSLPLDGPPTESPHAVLVSQG